MKTHLKKSGEKKQTTAAANRTASVVKNNGVSLKDNRASTTIQQKQIDAIASNTPIQKKKNNTGLPDNLKSGMESLSGHALDDVKVHYNSSKPAQLNAHAYAQGTNIHLASGQEKHLPHEAWHVVQQKQGRVQPTIQSKGVAINDDKGLEKEADVMGAKALQMKVIRNHTKLRSSFNPTITQRRTLSLKNISTLNSTIQRIERNTMAGEFGVDIAGLANFSISPLQEGVIRKILAQEPDMLASIKAGLKLETKSDFTKFVGSLQLNYDKIIRAMGKSEGTPPVHRDLTKANFPNTIEEVLSVIPHNAHKKILIPIKNKSQVGVEYNWNTPEGLPVTVRMHSHEFDRKPFGEKAKSHSGQGWIYRAIIGGKTMDIHGHWHAIESIVRPELVENPGGYSGTKPPNEANAVNGEINGIIDHLLHQPAYIAANTKAKKKMIKAEIVKSHNITTAVPDSKIRFVTAYILERSKYIDTLQAYHQYEIQLARYETTMNNIHIPLI